MIEGNGRRTETEEKKIRRKNEYEEKRRGEISYGDTG